MPARKLTFDTVRLIGLALPEVEESTTFAKPALKFHGDLIATLPSHKSAEPDSLVVRIDLQDRAELLASDPEVFYLTPHYEPYDDVLVRLSLIRRDVLEGLLKMAHRYVSTKRLKASASKKRERP